MMNMLRPFCIICLWQPYNALRLQVDNYEPVWYNDQCSEDAKCINLVFFFLTQPYLQPYYQTPTWYKESFAYLLFRLPGLLLNLFRGWFWCRSFGCTAAGFSCRLFLDRLDWLSANRFHCFEWCHSSSVPCRIKRLHKHLLAWVIRPSDSPIYSQVA